MRVLRHGFTLIELLVVIAIIAILAAILFPVFAKAREKARQAQCSSNQKQIAMAVSLYTTENDDKFPPESNIWNTLDLGSKVLRCPDRPKQPTSGYVYNYFIANEALGIINDPTIVMVSADGQHTDTDAAKTNVYYTEDDVDMGRHGENKYLASYVDGHVALATVPPGGLRAQYFYTPQMISKPPTSKGYRVDRQIGTDGADWQDPVFADIPSYFEEMQSDDPVNGTRMWEVAWTGWILPAKDGVYTFYTTSDDGSRLWINDVTSTTPFINNNWGMSQSATEAVSTPVTLVGGQKYLIRVEYMNTQKSGNMKLEWSGPSLPRTIISPKRLYPN